MGGDSVCVTPLVVLLVADEPDVRRIVCQEFWFDTRETRLFEHDLGGLPAPHGAQTFATLRQRDGHAMHDRDRVEQCSQRVPSVVVMVAGSMNVLRQVNAV